MEPMDKETTLAGLPCPSWALSSVGHTQPHTLQGGMVLRGGVSRQQKDIGKGTWILAPVQGLVAGGQELDYMVDFFGRGRTYPG